MRGAMIQARKFTTEYQSVVDENGVREERSETRFKRGRTPCVVVQQLWALLPELQLEL